MTVPIWFTRHVLLKTFEKFAAKKKVEIDQFNQDILALAHPNKSVPSQANTSHCYACKKKFKAASKPLQCSTCSLHFHTGCTVAKKKVLLFTCSSCTSLICGDAPALQLDPNEPLHLHSKRSRLNSNNEIATKSVDLEPEPARPRRIAIRQSLESRTPPTVPAPLPLASPNASLVSTPNIITASSSSGPTITVDPSFSIPNPLPASLPFPSFSMNSFISSLSTFRPIFTHPIVTSVTTASSSTPMSLNPSALPFHDPAAAPPSTLDASAPLTASTAPTLPLDKPATKARERKKKSDVPTTPKSFQQEQLKVELDIIRTKLKQTETTLKDTNNMNEILTARNKLFEEKRVADAHAALFNNHSSQQSPSTQPQSSQPSPVPVSQPQPPPPPPPPASTSCTSSTGQTLDSLIQLEILKTIRSSPATPLLSSTPTASPPPTSTTTADIIPSNDILSKLEVLQTSVSKILSSFSLLSDQVKVIESRLTPTISSCTSSSQTPSTSPSETISVERSTQTSTTTFDAPTDSSDVPKESFERKTTSSATSPLSSPNSDPLGTRKPLGSPPPAKFDPSIPPPPIRTKAPMSYSKATKSSKAPSRKFLLPTPHLKRPFILPSPQHPYVPRNQRNPLKTPLQPQNQPSSTHENDPPVTTDPVPNDVHPAATDVDQPSASEAPPSTSETSLLVPNIDLKDILDYILDSIFSRTNDELPPDPELDASVRSLDDSDLSDPLGNNLN